jgi:hypothetical protein
MRSLRQAVHASPHPPGHSPLFDGVPLECHGEDLQILRRSLPNQVVRGLETFNLFPVMRGQIEGCRKAVPAPGEVETGLGP